ncbi:hypothetical protein GALMADRAFT_1137065 [Galerina marginata CBS 339.88]|uniref:Bromo domain-containing protein n=1 Tax=Galerina marginata (strain CBS 339.88) TaxID=685588 RepID=A0A067SAJ4_GALM3|nr:hypothetical protein GALMADRAFT_1137065 [Galerina marginata CBS 339.88]
MDENAQSFSPFYSQPESPKIYLPKPAGSGLTLVIPSLKSLKAAQSASKQKYSAAPHSYLSPAVYDVEPQEKKIQRPVKLKPLKEVLTKLMAQLKKKDDYAFFLHPVDVSKVPGYADIVKRPMDLGTMSVKVSKGKYRSLEDFATDFRLVTGNAKLFNPLGSIYHTEADRLEVWGLDHISKAASTVIQYETDWNIEIEKDDDGVPLNIDEDEDDGNSAPTPMDVDTATPRDRSVSVASQVQQGPSSRRGPRGPYKKQGQTAPSGGLSETLEADGGLPGAKDGLGSFPPGSDWAKTMVALKLKGKRYKTKKERLRIEREGPPFLADGSLDYTEMEDPFSVLSFFVPDPPSRPHLVPLYPPLYNSLPPASAPPPLPLPQPQFVPEPSTSQSQSHSHTPQLPPGLSAAAAPYAFPAPTAVALDHPPLTLPFLQEYSGSSGKSSTYATTNSKPRRRHWTITRNATSRQKGKEKEDASASYPYADHLDVAELPAWQMPREAHAADFGAFGVLGGSLAEEMRRVPPPPPPQTGNSASYSAPTGIGVGVSDMGVQQQQRPGSDHEMAFDLIRASFDCESAAKKLGGAEGASAGVSPTTTLPQAILQLNAQLNELNGASLLAGGYWTTQRAAEAEEYVRDLVYGGVDGFAYVRSLAEFVDGALYHNEDDLEEPTKTSSEDPYNPKLGMPLAQWVQTHIVDPLTEGRHSLLRSTALELARQPRPAPVHSNPTLIDPRKGTIATQVAASLHLYPAALLAMSALMHIRLHKIDMGALIKTPNELFLSEEEWVGKSLKEKRRIAREGAVAGKAGGVDSEVKEDGEDKDDAMEVEEPEQTWAGVDASVKEKDNGDEKERVGGVGANGRLSSYEQEGPDELNEVLDYVAGVIVELDRRNQAEKEGGKLAVNGTSTSVQTPSTEDPVIRNLRLNLLALAKRAPLDTIARLPKDLVPEHIRHFVPTLGTSG